MQYPGYKWRSVHYRIAITPIQAFRVVQYIQSQGKTTLQPLQDHRRELPLTNKKTASTLNRKPDLDAQDLAHRLDNNFFKEVLTWCPYHRADAQAR